MKSDKSETRTEAWLAVKNDTENRPLCSGAAEGAAVAMFPGAAVAIGAGASALDTAINGAIDGDNLRKIVVDSLISGFVGAAAGDGGSELIKEGKNLILKSALSDFGNEMLYGSIENFSSWYANGIISTYDR